MAAAHQSVLTLSAPADEGDTNHRILIWYCAAVSQHAQAANLHKVSHAATAVAAAAATVVITVITLLPAHSSMHSSNTRSTVHLLLLSLIVLQQCSGSRTVLIAV